MPTCATNRPASLRATRSAGLAALAWAVAAAGAVAADPGAGEGPAPGPGCDCPPAGAPYEWDAPFFDLGWSLALRGAYLLDDAGARFAGTISPAVTLSHLFLRGGYEIDASADIEAGGFDSVRLAALRLAAAGEYRLDAVTGIAGSLELALTQDSPGDGEAAAPLVGSADAEIALSRDIGAFDVTLRGSAGRTVYSGTTLTGGTVVDNSAQDNWRVGAGLRLGRALTPVLTAFVDGSAEYEIFDRPSPVYLVKLDAVDYALRTGLAARWTSVLEAEASIGLGLRRFAEPGFADVASTLYDASLTFRPDETLALAASLGTAIGAPGPDASGVARIAYTAALDARYQVNPWLGLRASAGWSHASFAGSDGFETGYSAGAGLDYLLNLHTTLTADYAYSWSGEGSGAGEAEHRVAFGVTFAKPEGTLE